jgi:hypothetical protein
VFKMTILAAAASATALTALPAAAEARYRGDRYQSYGRHHDGYRAHRGYYNRRYHRPAYRTYVPVYGGYYGRPYYGRAYYGDRYYRSGYRCGRGTGGAIVGGAVGALLGREVARGGYRYRRGGGATGAILGGAAGALIGREIGRSC